MYRRLVESLAGAIPGLGLGSDLIVGFPGEADDDFGQTLRLVSDLPFTYLHVFPYSDRRGTEATALEGHLAPRIVAARSAELRRLGEAKSLAFRQNLVGGRQEVFVLERRERSRGSLVGLTGNYVEVLFDGPDALIRRLVQVEVTGISGPQTFGAMIAAPARP
jgi:threonylcarbamoyladenosine tRNA methylthiotransferase MtaB